jgi:hypothetical protein
MATLEPGANKPQKKSEIVYIHAKLKIVFTIAPEYLKNALSERSMKFFVSCFQSDANEIFSLTRGSFLFQTSEMYRFQNHLLAKLEGEIEYSTERNRFLAGEVNTAMEARFHANTTLDKRALVPLYIQIGDKIEFFDDTYHRGILEYQSPQNYMSLQAGYWQNITDGETFTKIDL